MFPGKKNGKNKWMEVFLGTLVKRIIIFKFYSANKIP